MPVLSKEEIAARVPLLKGSLGDFLFRITKIQKVNDLVDSLSGLQGADFASAFLERTGVEVSIHGLENIAQIPADGAFITISNHPYGGLDGIELISLLGRSRPDFKCMVNKILMRIYPLADSFIPVVPTGEKRTAPTKDSLLGVKRCLLHLQEGHPLGIFPSGAVSDLSFKHGWHVEDREWQLPVIRLIQKAKVPIVPIRFFDGNSRFYYSLGLIDWRVRLLALPSQLFNGAGRPFRVMVGPAISPETQSSYSTPEELRDFLRSAVYDMKL